MKAAFWTAIGAMFVPLGVLLAVKVPTWNLLAFCQIITGLVSIIAGWLYTIREERQKHKEGELRLRREKSSLIVLAHMAETLGVDMNKVSKMLEDKLDEE